MRRSVLSDLPDVALALVVTAFLWMLNCQNYSIGTSRVPSERCPVHLACGRSVAVPEVGAMVVARWEEISVTAQPLTITRDGVLGQVHPRGSRGSAVLVCLADSDRVEAPLAA